MTLHVCFALHGRAAFQGPIEKLCLDVQKLRSSNKFITSFKGALKNLCELVDDIWYYAGDKSVDSSWYTKRITLAAVYKSTEFFMLQDNSEGLPFLGILYMRENLIAC